LVETLVALILVSAVLLPSSYWLFHNRTSGAAWKKFRAVQILELKMNRALLQRLDRDWTEEISGPDYLRLEIHITHDGPESRLVGLAFDRQGQLVTELDGAYFVGKIP
jgi:hypothetical protein